MKKYHYIFTAWVLIILFPSCYAYKPISKEAPKNNNTYEVEYLFEHDGCKVYRFRDYGEYVYFTNCSGKVTSIRNDSTKTKTQNMINIIEKPL